MEKIIAAIRTLNDNLVAFKKETALEEANIHQRLDGMLDVTDGLRADLDNLRQRLDDYDSALANLTQRIFALEKTPTAAVDVVPNDDIGDALDDILAGADKDAAETEADKDAAVDVVPNDDIGDALDDILAGADKDAAETEADKDAAETEAGDMDDALKVVNDAMDDALKVVNDAMDGVLKDVENVLSENKPIDVDAFIAAHAPATTTTPAPTPTKKTPARAKAVAMTAVQKRAFARQYMVEVMNAKVEDLRSPTKIEETMASTEFEKWLSAR